MAKRTTKPVRKTKEPPLDSLAYRPPQVAELLNVSERTVFYWMKEGKLRAVQINGTTLVPRQAIEDLLKEDSAA